MNFSCTLLLLEHKYTLKYVLYNLEDLLRSGKEKIRMLVIMGFQCNFSQIWVNLAINQTNFVEFSFVKGIADGNELLVNT